MCAVCKGLVHACLLLALLLIPAAEAAAAGNDANALPAPFDSPPRDDGLRAIQDRLDVLKQQVSVSVDYEQLVSLKKDVEQLLVDTDAVAKSRLPEQLQLQAQLDVLGPTPETQSATETAAVVQQRLSLTNRKQQLDNEILRLKTIKENAAKLVVQIGEVRRNELESKLTLRWGSILSANFWTPLFNPQPDDQRRLLAFIQQFSLGAQQAWEPAQRWATVTLLLMALVLATLGQRLAQHWLAGYCMQRLPEGRLRRSALALAITLATLATVGGAFELVYSAFIQPDTLTPAMLSFATEFETLALTCVLLAGLSKALLSADHPSWRLPALATPVAQAMRPFPLLLASLILVFAFLLRMSYVIGMSTGANVFGAGLLALIIALVSGAALLRISQARKKMAAAGDPPEERGPLVGLLYLGTSGAVLSCLLCLLIGYIPLAAFIAYELVWFYIVLSSFYLLSLWLRDVCETLFSPRYASGKAIKQLLGIGDQRLEQIEIVLSGALRALLLLLLVVSLSVGAFGTPIDQLLASTLEVLGGEGLRKLNIVPRNLLNALLIFAIGCYLVRSLGRWLDAELLPKTDMDPGMRASLSTLFSNISYVFIVVLTLHATGVKWNNLAWIVSALSVGIGFGLQEIVKNFVSGLILLTERPVKVGDLVSIGGIEGDIRRINVRATEIQLSDRSIVIVPNSQLISQNLRNITTGGQAQGMAMLELTFPCDIDAVQVSQLLLQAYREHEHVLEKPAPSVRLVQISAEGILLRITGFVSSPRIVGSTKSELLMDILKRLNAAGIALASPKA